MFFRKSTVYHSTLQRMFKTAANRESIDTPFRLITLPKRFSGTGLSRSIKELSLENRSEEVINEDLIVKDKREDREKMPPKKLELAKKVKNLMSNTNMKIIKDHKRIHSISYNGGFESESKKLDTRDTNLPQDSSNMLENVSETNAGMENAIAKSKLNLRNLRPKVSEAKTEDLELTKASKKRNMRATVDMEMMKDELKQLEDPPFTKEEKLLSANRLGFEFFDVPCENLAKNLLGKILVRRLENGTLLKGKIVETESYLGGEDKASQTYQNKVTPRNIPMYMPPGTIYVYLTYGMYHCFNVSSRAPGASVFIRALEPTLGHSYMELLRNTQLKRGSKEKEMRKKVRVLKQHQLCNGPSKLCTAFEIDKETFNEKDITKSSSLWIEIDDNLEPETENNFTIIAAPRIGIDSAGPEWAAKPLRFYLFENDYVSQRNFASENNWPRTGAAVLIRALKPIEGMKKMAEFRNLKPTANSKSRSLRSFKDHELSNGPSKFCMAFNLNRDYSKYSMCNWRGMWIEDNEEKEDFHIIHCPRIGIESAGPEWASKPLRFYILGEQSVSKRDKKAEETNNKIDK